MIGLKDQFCYNQNKFVNTNFIIKLIRAVIQRDSEFRVLKLITYQIILNCSLNLQNVSYKLII